MPCYEVRTLSLEFKADNRSLLDAAIWNAGLHAETDAQGRVSVAYGAIVLDLERGTALVRDGYQNRLNGLKRAYATEAIKSAAKKAQWSVKWSSDNRAAATKLKW